MTIFNIKDFNTKLLVDFSNHAIYSSPFRGETLSSCVVFEKNKKKYLYAKSVVGFSEKEAYVAALKEKLALSIYSFFGIVVPETKILRLPIIWSHPYYTNALFGLAESRIYTYYICSNILKLNHCLKIRLPNEKALGAILAVGVLINDIDVLGNQFKNVGYINKNPFHWVKIDAGEAFSTIDIKHTLNKIQFCTQGKQVYLERNKLPPKVRNEFNFVLEKISSINPQEFELILKENLNDEESNELFFNDSDILSTVMVFLAERIRYIKDN